MSIEETCREISDAVISCKKEAVEAAVAKAINEGVSPEDIIEQGLAAGMNEVGILFENGDIFLAHLVLATDAMEVGIRALEAGMHEESVRKYGAIVIGTVEGDVHDVGKIVVSSMLRVSGFKVYDLGKDVPLQYFIDNAKEKNADMICLSGLTTISLSKQKELIEMLRDQGIRDSIRVMIGGASACQEWADRIGADAYAKNAVEAVSMARSLISEK